MSDDKSWRHSDEDFLAVEPAFHHLLCLLRNGHKSVDEEPGNARNEFHHSSHCDAEEQYLLDVHLSQHANQCSYNHAQDKGFAKHAKLLLQAFCIDVELREPGYEVETFVDEYGKGCEALAERLRDGYALHALVVALELGSSQVGHYECVDVANDCGKIAPNQALVHHEISYCSDKGVVPIVPQVDVDCTCGFGDEHQEIYAQTDGDDEGSNGSVISHSSCSRPTHVEHAELQVVEAGNLA